MKPGIYRDLSFEAYLRIDAINHSILKLFKRSAMHAHHEMETPRESQAFNRGDATHAAVLEPERFEESYVCAPLVAGRQADKRSKIGKAAWAAHTSQHPLMETLPLADWILASSARDAVSREPAARELLYGKGINEVSIVFERMGVLCKSRIDRLTEYAGLSTVVDFKTTRDASPWAFKRQVCDLGYHVQAGMYLDGLNQLAEHDRRFVFVCVETSPPFAVAVYELDAEAIEQGRQEYLEYLSRYKAATTSGIWPGYSLGIEELSLPPWGVNTEGWIHE